MASYSGVTHKQLAPLVHILGIVGIVLVVVWTTYYRGGYALTGGAVFNLHPLFMFAGFIFFSSQAVIAYKTVNGDKNYQKAVHLTLQGVAILLGVVGILAALKFHNDSGIQNFYSLHSWFGIITIVFYLVQWILGFVAFWSQSVSQSQRSELLPWHIFLGLTAYVTALVTAELGLLEKLTFLQKSSPPLGLWSSEAMLVNSIGLAVFVFGAVVVLTTVVPNSHREEGYRALE
jgi:cytochrome b-561